MAGTVLGPRLRGRAWWLAMAAGCLLAAGCGKQPERGPSASASQPGADSETPAADARLEHGPCGAVVELALAMERGRKLEREGKAREAEQLYRQLIARWPDRYEPYHRLGILADQEQRFDEAQQLYARAIDLRPDNPDVFNDLGYSLFLQGKLDEAERELLKAVTLAPTHARSRNNLGLVYGHLGRYQEALEQFLQAGSEADAHYNLAYVQASVGDLARAKQCLERALALDPDHERSRRALEEFRRFERDRHGPGQPQVQPENGNQAAQDGTDRRVQPRVASRNSGPR